MTKVPIRAVNMRTGEQIVAYSGFGVSMGFAQVFRSGSIRCRGTDDILMQDIIRIDGYIDRRWVPLITGQARGVAADGSGMITFALRAVGDVMVDSDLEPLLFGEEGLASQAIKSVSEVEFGIPVVFDSPEMDSGGRLDAMVEIKADFGTKALGFIVETAKKAGWLLLDDAAGRLRVCVVSEEHSPLTLTRGAVPFVSGSLSLEDKRIASIHGNATLPAVKQRGKTTAADVQLWANVTDAGARAGTREYFRSHNATTQQDLENECARRMNALAAQGMTYTCTVDGFLDPLGRLWEANRLITVNDPECGIDGAELVITTVTLSQAADASQQAILTLSPPALYRPESADAYVGSTGLSPVKGIRWWPGNA